MLRPRRAALPIVLTWLAAACVGVNLGGSYWPHYYLQLLPPVSLLAAAAVAGTSGRSRRGLILTSAVLPTLVWIAALLPMTPAQRQHAVPYYGRALRDQRVAAVVRAETRSTDQIYVLASEANIYFLSQRSTSYPYLWGKPITKIPGSVGRLRALLSSGHRPVLVLRYLPPGRVDPTGRMGRDLMAHYHRERTVGGVIFFRANDTPPPRRRQSGD
jgi:hypothetical protein